MSTNPVEDRVRDALAAVREQSVDAPSFEDLRDRRPAPAGTPSRRRLTLVAAAVLVGIVAVGLIARPDDQGPDVAAETEFTTHEELVRRAVQECLDFQAAAPPGAVPGPMPGSTQPDLAALREWHAQWATALAGTDDVFADVMPSPADEAWVDEALSILRLERDATRRAGDALDAGDAQAAFQALVTARDHGLQLSFLLAVNGATECDDRGVTRPTG